MLSLVTPPVPRNTTRSYLRPNAFRRPIVESAPRGQAGPVNYFQTKSAPADGESSEIQPSIIVPQIIRESPVAPSTSLPIDTASSYPYFVHFPGEDGSTCGGSLVHEDIILTAASCFSAQTADPYIASVEWKGGTKLTVSQRVMHPEFEELSLANDIMLVKIDAPRTEAVVTLATTSRPVVGESLRVMGFGLFNDPEYSSLLLETTINVFDFSECTAAYSTLLDENTQLCGGSVTAATGSCFSDEGGPLMDADEDIQYGVLSSTKGCFSSSPQVYTDLIQYNEFIKATICELSSNPPADCVVPTPTETLGPSSTPLDLSTARSSTQPSPTETLAPSLTDVDLSTQPTLLPSKQPTRTELMGLSSTPLDQSTHPTVLPSTQPTILPTFSLGPSPITKKTSRSPPKTNVFLGPTVEDASHNPSGQPEYFQTKYELDFDASGTQTAFIFPKIIDGLPVDTATTYPYFVHFAADDDTTCGGSLIYEDIILTAASCNAARIANPYIGSVEWKEGTQLNAIQRLAHPEFDEFSLANDIMLVKIDAPRTEALVTLATTSRPAVGESLRVMGFGLFNDTEFSSSLLEAEIEVLDFIECASTFSAFLDENTQICAGSVTAATGSCFDDEGGPLIDIDEDIQYGIFSLTESCMSSSAQIYTDVTQYIQFIQDAICKLSSNPPTNCAAPTPTETLTPFPTWSDPPVGPPTRPTDVPTIQPPTATSKGRSSKKSGKGSGKAGRPRSGKNKKSGKAKSRSSNKSESSKKGRTNKSNKRGNIYSETSSSGKRSTTTNNKKFLEWLKMAPQQGRVQNDKNQSSRSHSKEKPPTTRNTYWYQQIMPATKPERNKKAGKR